MGVQFEAVEAAVLSPPLSVFAPFNPSLPPLLQVSPALINANLCSLAGTKPAGRGPLP